MKNVFCVLFLFAFSLTIFGNSSFEQKTDLGIENVKENTKVQSLPVEEIEKDIFVMKHNVSTEVSVLELKLSKSNFRAVSIDKAAIISVRKIFSSAGGLSYRTT